MQMTNQKTLKQTVSGRVVNKGKAIRSWKTPLTPTDEVTEGWWDLLCYSGFFFLCAQVTGMKVAMFITKTIRCEFWITIH